MSNNEIEWKLKKKIENETKGEEDTTEPDNEEDDESPVRLSSPMQMHDEERVSTPINADNPDFGSDEDNVADEEELNGLEEDAELSIEELRAKYYNQNNSTPETTTVQNESSMYGCNNIG